MDQDLLEQLNSEKQALASHPALQRYFGRQKAMAALKHGNFKSFARIMRALYFNALPQTEQLSGSEELSVRNQDDFTRKKIAVFSMHFNSDDLPVSHLVEFANADYILFCEDCEKVREQMAKAGRTLTWQLRQIPAGLLEEGNQDARWYVKLHPAEYFPGYDYAVYLAPDIRMMADFRKMIQYAALETGLAMHHHPLKDDIYDQAEVLKHLHKSTAQKLSRQIGRYQGAGFPRHFGMFDTSMYVLDLHNQKGVGLLDAWWREGLKAGVENEDIAWPFVMWENDVVYDEVGLLGLDITKNPKLECQRLVRKSRQE